MGLLPRPASPPETIRYQWEVDTQVYKNNEPAGQPEWAPYKCTVNRLIEKAYEDFYQKEWTGKVQVFDKVTQKVREFDQKIDFQTMKQINPKTKTDRMIRRVEQDGQWECKVRREGCESDEWRVYSTENCQIIEAAYAAGIQSCSIYLPQISKKTKLLEYWMYDCKLEGTRGIQKNPKTGKESHMRRRPSIGHPADGVNNRTTNLFSDLLAFPDDTPPPGSLDWKSITKLNRSKQLNLSPGTHAYQMLKGLWNKTSQAPHGVPGISNAANLTRIQLIQAECMEHTWMGASEGVLSAPPPEDPTVAQNMRKHQAQAGLNNLKKLCLQSNDLGPRFKATLNDPKIMFVWHGGPAKFLHQIACTGPRKLRKTDGGYFGAGIYATPESWYARLYSMYSDQAAPPPECGVVLFAATLGRPYVVTRENDYKGKVDANGEAVSEFYSGNPHQGIALMPSVDSHYVACKAPAGSVNFQACSEKEAQCHEVILDSVTQLCPIAIFYYTQ